MSELYENPYKKYFQEHIPLGRLTNLCVSFAKNPVATFYNFHGLWGSPIEDWSINLFQTLLSSGINIASIETVPLSVTASHVIKPSDYLSVLRESIETGLVECKKIPRLSGVANNIANPHSMACRALLDLMFANPKICKCFDMIIFNNAYLLPPEKLEKSRQSQFWEQLADRSFSKTRTIAGNHYKTELKVRHLAVPPINTKLRKMHESNNISMLAKIVLSHIYKINPDLQCVFIQGTDDKHTAQRNESIFGYLDHPKVKILKIPGANHTFSNRLRDYVNAVAEIIDSFRNERGMERGRSF